MIDRIRTMFLFCGGPHQQPNHPPPSLSPTVYLCAGLCGGVTVTAGPVVRAAGPAAQDWHLCSVPRYTLLPGSPPNTGPPHTRQQRATATPTSRPGLRDTTGHCCPLSSPTPSSTSSYLTYTYTFTCTATCTCTCRGPHTRQPACHPTPAPRAAGHKALPGRPQSLYLHQQHIVLSLYSVQVSGSVRGGGVNME